MVLARQPNEPLDPDAWANITLDISTLTLGEAMAAEDASGKTLQQLARGVSLRMLALYVHGLRTYEPPPSWQELTSLRIRDVSRSTSQATSGGASRTSNP